MPVTLSMRRARSRSICWEGNGIRALGICRTRTSTLLPSSPEPDSYGREVSQSTMSPACSSASPPLCAYHAEPLVTSPSWNCSGSLRRINAGVRRECSGEYENLDIWAEPRSKSAPSA